MWGGHATTQQEGALSAETTSSRSQEARPSFYAGPGAAHRAACGIGSAPGQLGLQAGEPLACPDSFRGGIRHCRGGNSVPEPSLGATPAPLQGETWVNSAGEQKVGALSTSLGFRGVNSSAGTHSSPVYLGTER